jgi:ribonucleoside-triphosphate reductase
MVNKITLIRKRDGRVVDFEQKKITDAVFKAIKAVGGKDRKIAEEVSDKVTTILNYQFDEKSIPSVEEIQDIVEKVLIKEGHDSTAKAYILYREQQKRIREIKHSLMDIEETIDGYLKQNDWKVSENSNSTYSLSGLLMHAAGSLLSNYTLNNIYPGEIQRTHRSGDLHIHDLNMGIAGYCAGWSLRMLLQEGFNGVPGKVESRPPNHFQSALWQMINFLGTMQNEWAGAQAFSSFDTYLAPFVREDKLSYKEVKQGIQGFIFNMNVPSRWGGQTPFSNLTLDWMVPEDLKNENPFLGSNVLDYTYGDLQDEMDLINKAFIEVMAKGDEKHRIFTFPIPTYNITRDFDWDSEKSELLFEMTAKYGLPYFQNFINSELKPGDVRSMCCRLQMDVRKLRNKGGVFGAGEQTGSIGVVTLNMPRIGYISKTDEQFIEKVGELMELAKNSLEIKRKVVQNNIDNGLMPYSKRYLGSVGNHFSTIGLVGMNEALLNYMGISIASDDGRKFTIKVLDYMRERLADFQEETGHIFNLEATPAEGTSYRLAYKDKRIYPNIISANEESVKQGKPPYYTNSTQLPVGHTEDIFEALMLQDEIQCKYTGGTVFHGFIGENISDREACKNLVKKIAFNFKLPYFTITPTFSICPVHGYIPGEHEYCPFDSKEVKPNAASM